jgi:hypothetical protein
MVINSTNNNKTKESLNEYIYIRLNFLINVLLLLLKSN